MTKKALIFDTGTLITLSINGLLYILEELKKTFQGNFLITEAVKYETIDRPINVKQFELSALRIKSLLESKIIILPKDIGISNEDIKKETLRLLDIANSYITIRNSKVKIVSEGEISCLALSNLLEIRDYETLIAVDERTTRLLAEKPENLKDLMSNKLHTKVELNLHHLKEFSNFHFIRSTEIVYVAYKKGMLKISGPKVLEAALYATKFKGAAVSFEEIEELKRL